VTELRLVAAFTDPPTSIAGVNRSAPDGRFINPPGFGDNIRLTGGVLTRLTVEFAVADVCSPEALAEAVQALPICVHDGWVSGSDPITVPGSSNTMAVADPLSVVGCALTPDVVNASALTPRKQTERNPPFLIMSVPFTSVEWIARQHAKSGLELQPEWLTLFVKQASLYPQR
jgi:hypothetical protein